MEKNIYNFFNIYITNFLLILISIIYVNSTSLNITNFKIGFKNATIDFSEKIAIYKINTNFLNLNISITNINNIHSILITDKIYSDNILPYDCSNLNNFCQSK